ncbi:MAG TPA: HEAT repeat domain-containing protein [Ktedonobacteraceae bacterium]|nr:HEAT repeat domain-containing protein [Ktedonobacteraceae bacterium]
MAQKQQFMSSPTHRNIIQHPLPSRLLHSLLIGGAVALLIILVEAVILWLFHPGHPSGSGLNRLLALVTLPSIAIAFIELLLCVSVAYLVVRPFALFAYLRTVHAAQAEYFKVYMPVSVPTSLWKTLDISQEDGTSSPTSFEEQQVSLVDLIQRQDSNQLIIGMPGTGKTTSLQVYQYTVSRQPLRLILRRERVPVYVPLQNYGLFLKRQENDEVTDRTGQVTLLDFLYESDLPGMHFLRSELMGLAQRGRLLLLCDGLDEMDSNYLALASEELARLLRETDNRLVITCREGDYREQMDIVQLVEDGRAVCALVHPLQAEQICEVVEGYIQRQDEHWHHTAGQILQAIEHSRLRYHCTNPMMLFTLLGLIDTVGIQRGKEIDIRGRLLQEGVRESIAHTQQQPKWRNGAPTEREVMRFLSEVACAACWSNDRNAIQLPVSTAPSAGISLQEWAGALQYWLDEHPAIGPFTTDEDIKPSYEPYTDLSQLLDFALNAALIEISRAGIFSFRHELFAKYFVAEYFLSKERKQGALPLRRELVENAIHWGEYVALWAGLFDNPLLLAQRFSEFGLRNADYILPALVLSLACVGVVWVPPQADIQRSIVPPRSVEKALSLVIHDQAAREELASLFIGCAEEGTQEIYHSLLPLIMVEGVDDLLPLLDKTTVSELLFTQLQDTIDDPTYEAQVKRITQVLGRLGDGVVARAAQLSTPAAKRGLRLRAASINILGGTNQQRAVEPLMACLSDTEPFIVKRATSALTRLGPELTLVRLLKALEDRTPGPFTQQIHLAVLIILGRFLDEQNGRHPLTTPQYQNVLEKIVPVLTSNYQAEPEVQQLANELIVQQGRAITPEVAGGIQETRNKPRRKLIEALVQCLPSQNEATVRNVMQALQEIGSPATPRLIELLNLASEPIRVRVVEILTATHDTRALPSLLRHVNDASPMVQQQVAEALRLYAPESIAGLIHLVLSSPDEPTAAKAAQILASIGTQVVMPATDVLPNIVPGRTRLLVQVLEQVKDSASVPALIALLRIPQEDALLTIAIVHALSQFPDQEVVEPLIAVLADTRPQVYEEVITALSQLGDVAFWPLLAALNVKQETQLNQRIRRAILGMVPFPGEQLVQALIHSSQAQAQQITTILKMQGTDAAQALVRQLLHPDEGVRSHVQQTLSDMPGAVVVPALLEMLNQPAPTRKVVSTFLLKYPDAAISPLVELLGEHERGGAATIILPQFGTKILRPLISGLDDTRNMAWERAQSIIVALIRQSQDEQAVLREVVQLFYPTLPARAHERIIEVLTQELADVSIAALLEGLEDAHLMNDAAEALVRLGRKGRQQQLVLDSLLASLYIEERYRGASDALIKIGAPVVPRVGELITEQNQAVAKSAKNILSKIGVPALAFIWAAHSDKSNPARRAAAIEIFHGMPSSVIKDELVALLSSSKPNDIAMALALLMERIQDEARQHYSEREMIPELIEYVQTHNVEETNLRILALLLLLGEQIIIDHLLQTFDDFPQRRKQLTYILLLLGTKTQEALLEMFNDPDTSLALRAELATVLGMMSAPNPILEYAQNLSSYGIVPNRNNPLLPEQLAIALRALGSLLASGYWNVRKLQELHAASREGTPTRELFNVLLGWRYEPQIANLQSELQNEREARRQEVLSLTTRIVADQARIQALENDLETLQGEHSSRTDELFHTTQQNEELNTTLAQMTQERNSLRLQLEHAMRDKEALREQVEQLKWQLDQLKEP